VPSGPEQPSDPARHPPSLNAGLLCDYTIGEQAAGDVRLTGILQNISAARFPVVQRARQARPRRGRVRDRREMARLDDSHVVPEGTLGTALVGAQSFTFVQTATP
jgi:hypothetical protein